MLNSVSRTLYNRGFQKKNDSKIKHNMKENLETFQNKEKARVKANLETLDSYIIPQSSSIEFNKANLKNKTFGSSLI